MIETLLPFPAGPVDGGRLAQLLGTRDCLVFERFDLVTRRRAGTILGLRWTEVAGDSFEAAFRNALGSASADAAHLVFRGGDETPGTVGPASFPPFLVLRLDEYLSIDHAGRRATHLQDGTAAAADPAALGALLERAALDPAGVPAPSPAASSDGGGWTSDLDAERHARGVRAIQASIAAGEVDGAVLSVRLSKSTSAAPLDIYRQMIGMNPSTFGYCLVLDGQALIGSSPLAFLDAKGGAIRLETDAGTRPVTGNPSADLAARAELLSSAKDAREHAVVVEEEMRALAALADEDGIEKEVDREVRAFSHVMHLYTVLRARLRRGADLADAVLGLFPAAAASGKPRWEARRVGAEQEGNPRGPYGGLLGLVRGRDRAKLAVVIRSLWIEDGTASMRVGGKVVADSVGSDEYAEALNKARFIIQSVAGAEQQGPVRFGRRIALAGLVAAGVAPAARAQQPAGPAMRRGTLIPIDARLERVYAGGIHPEGPAVAPDGRLFFCDITISFASNMRAGEILILDPRTGETTIFRSPSGMAAGLAFDRNGHLVATEGADFGGRRVTRTDMRTGRAVIVTGLFEGRPYNAPNDLVLDRAGRIYFTDPRYFGHEPIEQPVFGVYRVDQGGAVSRIAWDVAKPNGIALSPDERTLYVSDNDNGTFDPRPADRLPRRMGQHRIWAFALSADGIITDRRLFVDYPGERGADGIKVDRDGNLWAAVQAASGMGVRVYAPDGREVAYVPVPEMPWNLALGADRGNGALYVTAGTSVYRIGVLARPLS
jgi:gluconolactonase